MKPISQGDAQKLFGEVVALRAALEKAEAELVKWKRGFELMDKSDQAELEERLHAEAELAELREECCDIAGNPCNELINRINNNSLFDALEMASVIQGRIRSLAGGEDV